jgi:hypothetical protein
MNRAAIRLTGFMPHEARGETPGDQPRWVNQLAELPGAKDDHVCHQLLLDVRSHADLLDVRVTKYVLKSGASLCLIHVA